MSIGSYHYFVEQYIKGEFLDEQKTLTSYIDNETYQRRQERSKRFLSSEQGDRGLQNNLTEEATDNYHFGRR
jgi:hypothetical protein